MTGQHDSGRPWAVWAAAGIVVVALAIVAVIASTSRQDTGVRTTDTSAAPGESSKETPAAPREQTAGGGSVPADAGSAADALPEYDAYAEVDPAVGRDVPTFVGHDAAGNEIRIEPDGRAKVVVFVAHWCPHCQKEVPLLAGHLADHPMPDDVDLLTVSTSVKSGAENYPPEEWLAREGWTAPVIADDPTNAAARAFGLSAFPFFVVVDSDGKIVERGSGERTAAEFDAMVEAAQGR